jgi:hypothetical protein
MFISYLKGDLQFSYNLSIYFDSISSKELYAEQQTFSSQSLRPDQL